MPRPSVSHLFKTLRPAAQWCNAVIKPNAEWTDSTGVRRQFPRWTLTLIYTVWKREQSAVTTCKRWCLIWKFMLLKQQANELWVDVCVCIYMLYDVCVVGGQNMRAWLISIVNLASRARVHRRLRKMHKPPRPWWGMVYGCIVRCGIGTPWKALRYILQRYGRAPWSVSFVNDHAQKVSQLLWLVSQLNEYSVQWNSSRIISTHFNRVST